MKGVLYIRKFSREFLLRIALEDIFAVKNSRLGHDLPISVNDRVILPFRDGLIFTKLRIRQVSRK